MNILAIDTTGEKLSLALLAGKRILSYERKLNAPHDETLMPSAERLLKRARTAWEDLDALAVASGPGKFTGIRIGMTYAAVSAGHLKIPVVAVSRFEAVAFKTPAPLVCALLKGFREEKFHQLFSRGAGAFPKPQGPPAWVSPVQWQEAKESLELEKTLIVEIEPAAEDLLGPALFHLRKKKLPKFEPLYLKPAGYMLGKK